ncbi:MAG: SLBB domain-containing protein [Smithellaceae bacterium]|nr:SLBB domain-containing protein [Smithellaceae bacterium]
MPVINPFAVIRGNIENLLVMSFQLLRLLLFRLHPTMSAWAAACLLILLSLFPLVAQGQEYQIGEGDLLKITVYDNPDLATEVRVSGEGKITVPLIGEVFVSGLTATEIGKKTAQLFAGGYIRNPQVGVFILEYKSKKVTVLGEFTKPGLIEMRGNSTLMEVISNAGGITANAGETLFIQRSAIKGSTDRKHDITISVDLTKLLEGGDISSNLPVLEGDSIYVPRAAFVYVMGEVKSPGAFKITKGLTVLRSITLAGGYTQKARKSKTQIIRKIDKAEKTLDVKMGDLVLPDDIIIVLESFF